jgi:AraC-like DNA-binding protein
VIANSSYRVNNVRFDHEAVERSWVNTTQYPTLKLDSPRSLVQHLQFAIDVFGEHFLSECLTPTINKAVRGFSFKVIHPCFVQVSDTALENDIIIIWKDVRGARHVSDREQDSWLLPTKSIELIPRGHSGIWRFDELSTLDIFEIDNSKKIEIAKTFGLNNNCLLNHIENNFDYEILNLTRYWSEGKKNTSNADNKSLEFLEYLFIYLLIQKYGSWRNGRLTASKKFDHDQVLSIKKFIEENISRKLTVKTIEDNFGFDQADFRSTFQLTFGVSPYQYILQQRIKNALTMLQESDLPIVEIALNLGFSSQAHFTTVFSKYFGCSPGRYRRSKKRKSQ